MYMKNTKKQGRIEQNQEICSVSFKNNGECKHNNPNTLKTLTTTNPTPDKSSTILPEPVAHFDKQLYAINASEETILSRITPFLTRSFGSPHKVDNKRKHRRKTVLKKGTSVILIYSEPIPNQRPLVVVLYDCARSEIDLVKRILSDCPQSQEIHGNGRTIIFVEFSNDPRNTISVLVQRLEILGYRLTSDKRTQVHLYEVNQTWTSRYFRITMRYQPLQPTLLSAVIQIDRFKPEVEGYVDLVWLLKSIESLEVLVQTLDIEYQSIFSGAGASMITHLLQKTIVKKIKKVGYCKERGRARLLYSMNDKPKDLQHVTHYIGTSSSSLQVKIYKKPSTDPKLEFVVRNDFLKGMSCRSPQELFNLNPWDSISRRVIFGNLDCTPTRITKNFSIYENAEVRADISVNWAKQVIPANWARYITIDENLTQAVAQGFSDLSELLKYIWVNVEGEDLSQKDSSVSNQNDTKKNPIFPDEE
jgi:hypothetical protein